jgi:hypothetical protein
MCTGLLSDHLGDHITVVTILCITISSHVFSLLWEYGMNSNKHNRQSLGCCMPYNARKGDHANFILTPTLIAYIHQHGYLLVHFAIQTLVRAVEQTYGSCRHCNVGSEPIAYDLSYLSAASS